MTAETLEEMAEKIPSKQLTIAVGAQADAAQARMCPVLQLPKRSDLKLRNGRAMCTYKILVSGAQSEFLHHFSIKKLRDFRLLGHRKCNSVANDKCTR